MKDFKKRLHRYWRFLEQSSLLIETSHTTNTQLEHLEGIHFLNVFADESAKTLEELKSILENFIDSQDSKHNNSLLNLLQSTKSQHEILIELTSRTISILKNYK